MAAKFQDAITWIVGQLQADSTLQGLGVTETFMYSAPERGISSLPYLIMSKMAGSHTLTMCGVGYDVHYVALKCVDEGFDGGETARNALHRARQVIEFCGRQTLASGTIMDILPSSSYEYDEQESGNENFFHTVQVIKVILGP
jgi:hypothetical protein